MELTKLNIRQAHQGLIKKDFSAVELTESFLNKAKRQEKDIHAYLSFAEEKALNQAKKIDERIKNNEEIGLLAGLPMAVKDIIMVDDIKCTAGSKILENYLAPYDATVIKKLKKEGAVIIGKTNLDEFAMGSSTENSGFGPTKNPYDHSRVPGGSSGGSAATIAAEGALYSLGTDTGGSIRQPSSFCGVVGLKPTYGRVSRYGLIAFASSLDQIGPITKTVDDARIVFEAIKGKDGMDSTSLNPLQKEEPYTGIKGLKIGVPKEYFIEGLDEKVKEAVQKAISFYQEKGAKIEEISLPHTDYALPCYYIIMPAEASANLERYDGIRYGLSERGKNLLEGYLLTRQKGFGDEVRRRIMLGTYTLSAGYYDAYYLKAQKVRTKISEDFKKAFEKVDILMGPTCPSVAFKIGEKINNPVSMYLSDVYTAPVNLAGLPAVSIPCGNSSENLPIGLQIIGNHFAEEKILSIAEEYEKI